MPRSVTQAKGALRGILNRLSKKPTKKKGVPIQECPTKNKEAPGTALLTISRTDSGRGISGVKVVLNGPTPGRTRSDELGKAQFDERQPGSYEYKAYFPKERFKSYNIAGQHHYVKVVKGELTVPGDGPGIANIEAYPTGDLKIQVVDESGTAVPRADVERLYTKAQSPERLSEHKQHTHSFQRVACGRYTVAVTVAAHRYVQAKYSATDVNVPEGGVGQAQLVVERLNIVEPQIAVDAKELWFQTEATDAASPSHPLHLAKAGAAAAPAEEAPVKLRLSYTETRPEKPYQDDGVLHFSNGHVAVFTDIACKTPLAFAGASAPIKNADLKKGVDLYLKGVAAGAVTATLTLTAPANRAFQVRAPVEQTLAVKLRNVIEPRLEVEYKVVLWDRELSKYQDASEQQIRADPTYILVSARQSREAPKYTKGAFLKAPANVEVFTNKDCKDKDKLDLSQPLPNDKLLGDSPWMLYLKGKTRGRFTLSLELEDPDLPEIRKLGPVEIEMGVVELEMKLHWHDVAKVGGIKVDPDTDPVDQYYSDLHQQALPEQVPMTDQQKVETGRLLHAQTEQHHGRAKLVVEIPDASHWPDGVDDYRIFLNRTKTRGGAVSVWDSEWGGKAVRFPVGPLTVKGLKTAKKTYWVEGESVTNESRQVVLDLTLDRPDTEAPNHDVKEFADWARFTVVRIEEVKIDYTAATGQAVAWDEVAQRFYINLEADPNGRKITIGAQLSEKLEHVVIHFMLAPDQNNMKAANWGKDLPNNVPVTNKKAGLTWTWKNIDKSAKHGDKSDRKGLLHLSQKTDANGYAKVDLTLSRFGGDRFRPGAYIEQDPHLAKYVPGDSNLKEKEPVLATHAPQVWRRFWYQLVKVENFSVPNLAPAVAQYDLVKAEMKQAGDLVVTHADVSKYKPQAIYPMYMVRVNGTGDALVVSDRNKNQFFTGYTAEADKPIKVPILICDAQWDANGDTGVVQASAKITDFPLDVAMNKVVLNPPLQGGKLLVKGGKWEAARRDQTANGGKGAWADVQQGQLVDTDLSINASRDSLNKVTIAKPRGIDRTKLPTHVWIEFAVQGAAEYLGESFNKRILAVYDPKYPDDFQNTIVHELGHAFAQVPSNAPATGIPVHPIQANAGQGNHCRQDGDKCVMYDSGPITDSYNRFCDICHPYLLVQDMFEIV